MGKLTGKWGTMADVNEMQFSSKPKYHDLYDFGFRWYSPDLDRFLTVDPIQEWGGINLYRAVFNNPLRYVDPLGLQVTPGYFSQTPVFSYTPLDPNNLAAPNAPPISISPNNTPDAPVLSPGNPNAEPYIPPPSPLQYQSLTDIMGNGSELTPDQAQAVATPIVMFLPLPVPKVPVECPAAAAKAAELAAALEQRAAALKALQTAEKNLAEAQNNLETAMQAVNQAGQQAGKNSVAFQQAQQAVSSADNQVSYWARAAINAQDAWQNANAAVLRTR